MRLRPNVKRHLVAAALSTLIPGAGQLFLGRKRKAGLSFVALIVISIGFFAMRLPSYYPGLIFLVWMCFLLSLFAIFEALLAQDGRLPGRMSRWWILGGIPMHYLGVNLIFTSLLIGSGFHTFKFGASAMQPTIFAGDKFVVDNRYYRHRSPDRNDLVLMRTGDAVTVKRIIAGPGDTIEGRDRKVFLNNRTLDEPFVLHKFPASVSQELDRFGPVTIPPSKYFVMGDNRDVSLDSRAADFGLVASGAILGKPLYGYHIIDKPLYWKLK